MRTHAKQLVNEERALDVLIQLTRDNQSSNSLQPTA